MTKEQFLLLKMIEECAEVAQRASKQIQFGGFETQGKGSPSTNASLEAQFTNAERLRSELLDLTVITQLLIDLGAFKSVDTFGEYEAAKQAKVEKLNKYLAYSRKLGQLDGDWTV